MALMSENRVEFGLGAGWMSSDYRSSGIPEDRPGVRVSRMEEALALYTALWTHGTASLDGEHYQVVDAVSTPVLSQRPPIIIGGGSPRVLGIAARHADIVGVNPNLAAGYIGREVIESTQAEYFDERVRWVREAAGDRFAQLELQILTFFVTLTNERQSAIDGLAGMMGVTSEQVAETPVALIGSVNHIVETLQMRRERFGFNYVVVHEAVDLAAARGGDHVRVDVVGRAVERHGDHAGERLRQRHVGAVGDRADAQARALLRRGHVALDAGHERFVEDGVRAREVGQRAPVVRDALPAPDAVDRARVERGVERAPLERHPAQFEAHALRDQGGGVGLVARPRAVGPQEAHQGHRVEIAAAERQHALLDEAAHGTQFRYMVISQSVTAPQKRAHSSRLKSA